MTSALSRTAVSAAERVGRHVSAMAKSKAAHNIHRVVVKGIALTVAAASCVAKFARRGGDLLRQQPLFQNAHVLGLKNRLTPVVHGQFHVNVLGVRLHRVDAYT